MSLLLWLPLNGDLRNQGLADATITNNGATINSGGKIGSAYAFDGTQYITVKCAQIKNTICSSSQPFTMSCWIYLNSDETDRVIIFGNYSANPFLNWELTANCEQRVGGGGTSNFVSAYDSSIVPKTTWTHIAVTFDGTNTKFYQNGILGSTRTTAYTITSALGTDTFWLGSDGRSVATRLKGRLNDFKFYDEALSPKQIKLLSQGLVLHYPLSRVGGDNLALNSADLTLWAKESGMTCEWDSTEQMYKIDTTTRTSSRWGIYQDFNCEANTIYTFSVEGKKVEKAMYLSVGSYKDTATWPTNQTQFTTTRKRLSYTFTTGADHNKIRMYLAVYPTTEGSNAAYYALPKLEKNNYVTPWIPNIADAAYTKAGLNNGIEYDVSGYGNNGTITGELTYSSDTPKYNTSTIFNGSQYIKSSNEISTDDSTISLWIKVANLNANYHILDCRNSTENGKQPIYNYTDGSIQSGGSNSYVHSNSGLLVNNIWVHIVLVQSGNTLFIYKNGTLFQTLSCTNSPIISPTIGARFTHANYFKGQLSDFRIYATALSADDILELYNTPVHLTSSGALLTSGELTEV